MLDRDLPDKKNKVRIMVLVANASYVCGYVERHLCVLTFI